MAIIFAGLSDIGRVRKTNQDSIFSSKNLNFFLVADGMGGHKGGDIASALAVKSAPEFLNQNIKRLDDPNILVECFKHSNENIYQKAQENAHLRGMGTTMTSLLFTKNRLTIANVGDSRAYLINKQHLFQLSKDHSLVQEKLNLGIYARDEARADVNKNVLIRTIGFEPQVEIDIFNFKVSKNDMFLICSDGLHGKVSDRDIAYIINSHIPSPAEATKEQVNKAIQELINQANQNGGQDNISAILTIAQ